MGWWAKFWESKPGPVKQYLGWTQMSYTKNDEIHECCTIHFYVYATGDELSDKRYAELGDKASYMQDYWKRHSFWQQSVVPWLHGGDLYWPIREPSDWFKSWVKRCHGYTRFDGKWVKPAPEVERDANVIVPAKWGQRGDS